MFQEFLAQCMSVISTGEGLALSLFLGGLAGGFLHCTAMCGPFVLAQTGARPTDKRPLLIPYHLGRMTTYLFMAFLVSAVLNLAFLFSPGREWISAIFISAAALLFLINAVPFLSGWFPALTRIVLPLPRRAVERFANPFIGGKSWVHTYLLGVVLGFLPCGMVVAALMAVAGAPTTNESLMAMAAFSVGTMPGLMALGLGGSLIKQHFPGTISIVTGLLMLFSGFLLLALAVSLIL